MASRRAFWAEDNRQTQPYIAIFALMDKWLSLLYVTCVLTSIISLVSLAIAWQHWSITLDGCISFDCGCILYCTKTFAEFLGGHVSLCRFGAYGLFPSILIGFTIGCVHLYRWCMPLGLSQPRAIHKGYESR